MTLNLEKRAHTTRRNVVNKILSFDQSIPMVACLQEVNKENWGEKEYAHSTTNAKIHLYGDTQLESRLRIAVNAAANQHVMQTDILYGDRWMTLHLKDLVVFNVHMLPWKDRVRGEDSRKFAGPVKEIEQIIRIFRRERGR